MPCVPKPRSQRRNHHKELGLARGVWHAELVGVSRNYPKTPEAFASKYANSAAQMSAKQAAGKLIPFRNDLPPGMKSYEFARLKAKAAKQAQKIVEIMAAEDPDLTPKAREALAVAAEIMLAKDENTKKPLATDKNRLAAARLIMDFVQAKPAQRVEATVAKAEDFLTVLAAKGDDA